MQRLNQDTDNERGATAVMVALMMVMLLSFGAISVDVGAMYAEKSVVQNGADAAALAVAQKCAKNTADTYCISGSSLAGSLANANAKDNLTDASTVVDKAAGTVTVTTNAQEASGVHFSTFFARIFGTDTTNISAVAEAHWGGVQSGTVPFPIAFSECEVDSSVAADGSTQFLLSHGIGAGKKDTCHNTASGLEMPGGFGWLVPVAGSCSVKVDLASPWVSSNTGNSPEQNCSSILQAWKDKLIAGQKVVALFPVFDKDNGLTGNNGKFLLKAFVAIDLMGWDLANQDPFKYMPASALGFKEAGGYSPSALGIVGKFVRYVSLDEAFEVGGPTTYGNTAVELTK